MRAWQAHDPDADWHLVIEDDGVICQDLPSGLERILDSLPCESVASLYIGNTTSGRSIAPATREVSWVKTRSLVWGVAIAAPVASIEGMLTWCNGLNYSDRVYDSRVAHYYTEVLHWPAYYTWPSLVDHAQVPSLLKHAPDRQAQCFIGETASAHDFDPFGPVRRTRKLKENRVSELLVAKTNAVVQYRGKRIVLRKGATVAESGADIVRDRPHMWEPLKVDFPASKSAAPSTPPVEQTTAAPGEQRDIPSTKTVRDWAREHGYDVPIRGKLPADVIEAYQAAQDADR